MNKAKERVRSRKRRAFRVRKKIIGTAQRPRLSVRRSLKHIYAQLIDDINGLSIVQIGSMSKEALEKKESLENKTKSGMSAIIGELVADKALEKGIKTIVFDRKGYPYHGRVKALAEAARNKGLIF